MEYQNSQIYAIENEPTQIPQNDPRGTPSSFPFSGIYQVFHRKWLSIQEYYLIFKRTAFLCLAFWVRGILKFEILRYYVVSVVKYLYIDIEWNFPNCMIFEYKVYSHLLFKAFNSLWTKSLDSALHRPVSVCLAWAPPCPESQPWVETGQESWVSPPTPALGRMCTYFSVLIPTCL